MRVLVTGSTGLLGQALCSRLARSCELIGLSRHAPREPAGRIRHIVCDLADATSTRETLRALAPEVVIHAQALSDVDRCEEDPQAAWAQNVTTTVHLVDALTGLAATPTSGARPPLLVFVSTDYVFDGTKGSPYDEHEATHPLNAYGRAKLEGERAAQRYPRAVVARTSTLFGRGRANFCDHLIERLTAGEPVDAFSDQVTSPTFTDDVAAALEALSRTLWDTWHDRAPRVYHLANEGGCSRLAFAQRVAQRLRCERSLIRPIRMADQRRPAPRPAYSALRSRTISPALRRMLRPWDEALDEYLRRRSLLDPARSRPLP